MERLHDENLIKSIGVANFKQHHLSDLLVAANEKPVLNQVETHPLLPQMIFVSIWRNRILRMLHGRRLQKGS